MTPSASRSPKRLPSSCPHGHSQIDVRKRDAAAARPRTRPEPPGPARPVRFALAGREPRVASDLPADRGRMPSRHHGHAAHARPVAHLNPDDPPFLFRQVRIHLAQGATPLRLATRTISNLTGVALSIRQRAKEQKNVHLRGPVSVCLSGQKEKPRSYAGLFQRGHKRGRERPRLMVDEVLGPRQVSTSSDAARWTVRTGASWPDQS